MESIGTPLLWISGGLGLLYALHRSALFLEARGWLYYRNVRPRFSAIVAFGAALDPTVRHILEAQQQECDLEEDESGDPTRRRRPHGADLLVYPDKDR